MRYGAALFLLVAIASSAVLAQSPQAPVEPRFEVASVKAALSPAELGRLAAQNGGPPPMPRFGIQTQDVEADLEVGLSPHHDLIFAIRNPISAITPTTIITPTAMPA